MTPLNWRAIFVAIAIWFVIGCVVGVGWGMVAFPLAMTIGPSIESYIDSPVLVVIGFIVGLIPTAIGAIYLGRQLESRLLTHSILYSFSNILISAPFMLIPSEAGNFWTSFAYCVLCVPISIAFVAYSARSR